MNLDLTELRPLDAAPERGLDDAARRRAEAGLRRILTADVEEPPASPTHTATSRRRVARWLAIPAAAAAALALTSVLPGRAGPDPAYASWTPVPRQAAAADRAVADGACRRAGLDLSAPTLALAERRGNWMVLLYTSSEPVVTACMAHLPPGDDTAGDIDRARAGGRGAVPRGGQFTEGAIFQFGGARAFGRRDRPTVSLTEGEVGEDVAALSIQTEDGRDVRATVADGRYVAWWPGEAFGSGREGNGAPAPSFTYTVTLTDGTVVRDAQPTLPD